MLRALGSRLQVAGETSSAISRRHPDGPHWYLSGIGTEPALQRTGVGGLLLTSRLGQCDAAGLPAYLETGTTRNVALYERHGFKVISEHKARTDAPNMWSMWREAGA
jgi:ribosomal protein S18 acetylase RimI-like enzyme